MSITSTLPQLLQKGTPVALRVWSCLAMTSAMACSRMPSEHRAVVYVSPIPQATPAYETFPVSAAFSKFGPPLTSKQRRWILRVVHSRNYGSLRPILRFADLPGLDTPIVVYINRSRPGEVYGGHVIGEGCNVWFDPMLRGLFVGTGALCSPPTPRPVR